MDTRVTSATVLVNWDTRIHAHALLIFGSKASQCKNYEECAIKVSKGIWSLDFALKAFWGKGQRVPMKVASYFMKNPVTSKPKGFENGVRIQFEFGVAKIFDTGKGLLTVSLKGVPKENITKTLASYVESVHKYIKKVGSHEELEYFSTQLDLQKYTWDIVSINSTSSLFPNHIDLNEFYLYSSQKASAFYDSEYHRGYMQLYLQCRCKRNTVCIYHTGKCVIMGIKSLESLSCVESQLGEIVSGFVMDKIEKILSLDSFESHESSDEDSEDSEDSLGSFESHESY